MIDTSKFMEKFLQGQRFSQIKPYLVGDVLDFGGNYGELKQLVKGRYLCVNYDISPIEGQKFDTIVALAVIEHLPVKGVYEVFHIFKSALRKKGHICITTPAPLSKPVLEVMALLGIVDRENIKEHQHYWTCDELNELAHATGFIMTRYQQFQFGFNQMATFVKEVDE